MKYTTTVDAFRYDGDLKGSDGKYYVPMWAVDAYKNGDIYYDGTGHEPCELFVKFKFGTWLVEVGDYVGMSKDGKIQVFSKKVFEELYDPLKEPQATNIETYQSITGIILKAEPAVRIGELNYTATEQQPQTGERREQGYRVRFKSGVTIWMDKTEFERIHTKVLFPKKV